MKRYWLLYSTANRFGLECIVRAKSKLSACFKCMKAKGAKQISWITEL